jgi:hypothetical protein
MPLQSNRALLYATQIRDTSWPSIEEPHLQRSGNSHAADCESARPLTFLPAQISHEQVIRKSVLLTICESLPQRCLWIEGLSSRQWRNLLRWLDYHGLALYFFDRLTQIGRVDSLPATVLAVLERRLHENTLRTRSMTSELIAIQLEFQKAGLLHAVLKGLSFWPSSVHRLDLRSQFDLDFLVAKKDLPQARQILEHKGYRLYGSGGRSWEFKRNERPGIGLNDLYKDTGSWRVELHAEPTSPSRSELLERLEWRDLSGVTMPVLSPVDLFLGQGTHACKHLCAEFCRAAHLVEFRRHVVFRQNDRAFWEALRREADKNGQSALKLGTVLLLIAQVTGEFAPKALTKWTVDPLPQPVRLWTETYGHRAVLGNFPGNKLYLLLQRELESGGVRANRSIRRSLFPSRLPPPVIRAFPGESLPVRLARYRMQLDLFLSRLRFHLAEGVRFAWESRRWRRLLSEVSR